MNQEKLNDMYYFCETYKGGYESIDYLETLEGIARKIEQFNNNEITVEEFLYRIGDSKCPFLKNGDTINGLCFTEPKLKSPMQNKEIRKRCHQCWKNFLEVE